MSHSAETARLEFVAYCHDRGTHHVRAEDEVLSVGREYLPAFAIAVLDKTAEPTAEYYDWLLDQTMGAYEAAD